MENVILFPVTEGDPGSVQSKSLMLSLRFGDSRLTIRYGSAGDTLNMRYNPRKAAQVIAYYALKTGQRSIDLIKAMKLVYLGDRESIVRWGEPILNEPRFALPNGPVNDLTYAHAKGDRKDPDGWSSFLEDRADNTLDLKPGIDIDDLDELSDADREALDAVWRRFGGMQPMALCGWTHKPENVPEWENPEGSSRLIPLERIMQEVGIANPGQAARRVEQRRTLAEILAED